MMPLGARFWQPGKMATSNTFRSPSAVCLLLLCVVFAPCTDRRSRVPPFDPNPSVSIATDCQYAYPVHMRHYQAISPPFLSCRRSLAHSLALHPYRSDHHLIPPAPRFLAHHHMMLYAFFSFFVFLVQFRDGVLAIEHVVKCHHVRGWHASLPFSHNRHVHLSQPHESLLSKRPETAAITNQIRTVFHHASPRRR